LTSGRAVRASDFLTRGRLRRLTIWRELIEPEGARSYVLCAWQYRFGMAGFGVARAQEALDRAEARRRSLAPPAEIHVEETNGPRRSARSPASDPTAPRAR